MNTTYAEFLAGKEQLANKGGFEPVSMPEFLFPFQSELVAWAIRQGRGGLFADCGMGKTPMELTWADNVYRHTGQPVLILTPLAVTFQIQSEAAKFGFDAEISRDGSIPAPITITNYERLEKFDARRFAGVVCDESSAIKSFDGQRRAIVTEFMRRIPYRLLGTATAAPNDYTELGTSSEALGHLGYMDMLNRFFRNDNNTSDTKGGINKQGQWLRSSDGGWRFKGHAVEPFWRWVSSWARAIRRPSDYGYDDGDFILPELITDVHHVDAVTPNPDTLFEVPAFGMREEREELRRTLGERCEAAAAAIADAETSVSWCHLNDEAKLLTRLIPDAVELSGSDTPDEKEAKLLAFSRGEIKRLVTKPVVGAWGLNWQHCHRMTYFPSHSYEQYYQAVRRCWRFGQTNPVQVHVVTTTGGERVLANLQRKAQAADQMFTELVGHMNDALQIQRAANHTTQVEVPAWLTSSTSK